MGFSPASHDEPLRPPPSTLFSLATVFELFCAPQRPRLLWSVRPLLTVCLTPVGRERAEE